ncbi:dihydrolipoamide acetyltransferase family protein [Microbacterium sp. EST19A]|uniref:dihydrolipoamide acetyltransferase family protein n=1 Tax=Microbacterium sp. EST19A TaxID=2862681 RepID=UPI001CBF04B8|nr:dihydrolipoamide acetyltransferase family protein [Microbacterium sp. EST19A]
MIDILMPRLSDTMTEGAIASWHKKPGDAVAPGDLLVEIETDKALMEQEAYDAGVLVEILVPEGENVAIGTPIARLDDGSDDDTPSAARTIPATSDDVPESIAEALPSAEPPAIPLSDAGEVPADLDPPDNRAATPLVRRLARERGVDLDQLTGTGPGGRIIRADLDDAALEMPSAAPEFDTATTSGDARESQAVPFDRIRQAIAARLTESAIEVPTFTATISADVDGLLTLRSQINQANAESGTRISVNDLLVRAAALALRMHPGLNASYSDSGRGTTLVHGRVHIGVAVASPAGLVVPVIKDADRTAVSAIAATSRNLIAKATERTLTAEDMSDGTFTISNLGMFGIEHFTAIINPPQGAILAVGAAKEELVLVDGDVTPRTRLRLTLTADHRIIDGALAARFLATIVQLLEHPLRIVA